ncbi:hypothetical protein [Nocardioides zeae]
MRKEKDCQGYHRAALARPVASWKIADATSTPMEARSATSATFRPVPGGKGCSKRGCTDHSLTSSSGTQAMPVVTWRPWVKR